MSRMLKLNGVVFLMLGWLLFTGCDQEQIDECPAVWKLETAQLTAKAEIRSSELHLEVAAAEPGVALSLYQEGLSGDFSITAEFDGFIPGTGTGGFAQMIVYDPLQPQEGITGNAIANGRIESFVGYPGGLSDSRLINGSQGTMTIAREGNVVTTSCTVGMDQSQKVQEFISSDLRVAFQIGSNDTTLSGTTGIRIQEFLVEQGAGISADDFSCDSYLY